VHPGFPPFFEAFQLREREYVNLSAETLKWHAEREAPGTRQADRGLAAATSRGRHHLREVFNG
jgi:hypothetical protein